MKTLLQYFSKYKKECVLGPLFKLLEASFELLVPLVVVRIIDIGIAGGHKDYIIKMCLIMVALGVIGLVCSLTAQYFSAKAAVGFAGKVREALFSKIQSMSYTQIDGIGTATMITRMTSDVNQLQNGVNMTLRLFLRSPFIVFGAAIMAFTIDVKAAMVFVVVIPLLSIVVYGIMLITIPMYKRVQASLDKVLGRTRDNISGVRVIRAFGVEKRQTDEYNKENAEYVHRQLSVGRISALTNPVTFAIINVGIALLIWRGAIRVGGGYITQGQLVALVNYMSQILVELIKLANFIVLDIKALASASRIESVLLDENVQEMTDDNKEYAIDSEGSVVFENVSLTYKGGSDETLSNISFYAKKGEIIGIIGSTGSGKSSLINLIPGFYKPSKGRVFVDGLDTCKANASQLLSRIAVVPQKALLFAGTIRQNMLWGNEEASDEDIINALEVAQAMDFVSEKQGVLDFELTQGGKNLSGGQRQRLTVARAIVKKSDILILDDSSSALDAVTDMKLRESIRSLEHRPTVFIVSQRTASIMGADRILVLDDGHLVGNGTHEELLAGCDVYKEIYESQVR